jgi:hypothetical protein
LPSGSYVTQWYFNIFQNTEIAQPQQLGQITDPRASFLLSPDNLYAGTPENTLGQGFDFSMTFPSAGDNLFTSQASAAFLFTDPTGIIAAWFNQLNTAGNFYAAANVLSLSGAGSSIAATSATTPGPGPGPAPVPEPATMILLSCGMACLTFFGRRKFLAYYRLTQKQKGRGFSPPFLLLKSMVVRGQA